MKVEDRMMPLYTDGILNGHEQTSEARFSEDRSCAMLWRIELGSLQTDIEVDTEEM